MPGRVTHPPGGESCHAPGGAAAGAPAAHRVGEGEQTAPHGGRCRAGLGFLWRKPKRKSTRGLRPPGPPGGFKVLAPARRILGL